MNQIEENISLKPFNTFGILSYARFFKIIESVNDLQILLKDAAWKAVPKLILGGGSNILFTKDFSGLVIKNEIKGVQKIQEDEQSIFLKIGAGENWHEMVLHAIHLGLGGIENLSLIPGTVGAAPIQNIGAYGMELKEVFSELEAINVANGDCVIFSKQDCQFGYRDSVFKKKYKDCFVIASVTLRLNKKPCFNVSYDVLNNYLQMRQSESLSLKVVSDAVIAIRQTKLPDPKIIGNAGSFFKNPVIPLSQFNELQAKNPTMPHFVESDALMKVPAGWLIERSGWKGKRLGQAGVHDKQALVLVNYGDATGAEVQALASQIQKAVKEQFGIDLMPEVNII